MPATCITSSLDANILVMLAFLKRKFYLMFAFSVFIFVISFFITPRFFGSVHALTCTEGMTYEIDYCYVRSSDHTCIAEKKGPYSYTCGDVNGVCMGYVKDQICGYVDGECQKIPENPTNVRIPCGSTETCDGAGEMCNGVQCAVDQFCADGFCASCDSGGGGGCTISNPASPALTLPSNKANFISPPTTSIWFKWNFSNWNDCCTTTECKNNRKLDLAIYNNCSPEDMTGKNVIFYDKTRNLGWTVRSKWVYNFPSTSMDYCWRVSVTNGRTKQNSSSYRFFTINSTSTPPPITPPPSSLAWWQGKDTDIIANDSIRSYVPSGLKLILNGDGGYPGVAVYGNGKSLTLPIIGAGLSFTNWKAQTDTNLSSYRFASFSKKTTSVVFNPCPSNLSSIAGSHTNADPQGYVWYKCQGTDLNLATTGTANITDNKIVIMVEGGNVNIKTKINLTKGVGFFGVFTTGDINISKTVGGSGIGIYDLEGIYFADGTVNTASDNVAPTVTTSLKFRGSVVGMGGVSLQRDLGSVANKISPAEFFEYAPDQLFLLPSAFSTKKTQWQEVAP